MRHVTIALPDELSAALAAPGQDLSRAAGRSGPLVEKHVKRYDPAVTHDDEISPGVGRHFTRASRYPWNHPCIAIFLRIGSHLISKVRMSRLDRARDAIDLVPATNSALAGIVEHAIFGPEFVDGRAPSRGIVFTEDVVEIAGQQGRYAVGHGLSPLGIECAFETF